MLLWHLSENNYLSTCGMKKVGVMKQQWSWGRESQGFSRLMLLLPPIISSSLHDSIMTSLYIYRKNRHRKRASFLLLLLSHSVVSDSAWPHRSQPTRLLHPWDSSGKNTGVGCHFLLQCMHACMHAKSLQSCPTLCNPMDSSLPGSSVHGILQAKLSLFLDFLTLLSQI